MTTTTKTVCEFMFKWQKESQVVLSGLQFFICSKFWQNLLFWVYYTVMGICFCVVWDERTNRFLKFSFLPIISLKNVITLSAPCISESCIKIRINSNIYFHTTFYCFERFYEGIKSLHKTFWSTAKKCENKTFG